jgi:hypothetical protein
LEASPAVEREEGQPRIERGRGVERGLNIPIRSKISLTKELRMSMALFEIPVSG